MLSNIAGEVLSLFDGEPFPLAIDGKTPNEVWIPYGIKF